MLHDRQQRMSLHDTTVALHDHQRKRLKVTLSSTNVCIDCHKYQRKAEGHRWPSTLGFCCTVGGWFMDDAGDTEYSWRLAQEDVKLEPVAIQYFLALEEREGNEITRKSNTFNVNRSFFCWEFIIFAKSLYLKNDMLLIIYRNGWLFNIVYSFVEVVEYAFLTLCVLIKNGLFYFCWLSLETAIISAPSHNKIDSHT